MKTKIPALVAIGLWFTACLAFSQTAGSGTTGAAQSGDPVKINVLVVYHSVTGNTEKMAKAVAEGVQKVAEAHVSVMTPDKVTEDDLVNADAMILGSPTYFGNMAGQMKSFIDDWFFKYKTSLVDKVGGAFSSGGSETGGKENVIYSMVIAMMNAGMIIAGPTEGQYGMVGVTAIDPVNDEALKEARLLGERVAKVALELKKGRK